MEEQTPISSDIAIVGGGAVGLSLALMLVQSLADVEIVIIDRFPIDADNALFQSSFDARATAISQDSMDILGTMNLWPSISRHATAIRRVHVSDRGHVGSTSYSEKDNDDRPLGAVVENAWLGNQLAAAAESHPRIKILAPATAQALRPRAKGYSVALQYNEQSRRVDCGLAVIADGADSPLRRQLGIAVDEFNYHQHAIIANVETEHAHGGQAFERFTESGPMALLPLGESDKSAKSALVWTMPEASLSAMLEASDEAFLQALQAAFGCRLGQFLRLGKRSHYPLKRLLAREQVRSHLVLVGNAAHCLHPVAGQGFNLALRDCEQLVKVLVAAEGESSLPVLERYQAQQHSDQWLTTMISHGFVRLFTDSRPTAAVARNGGLLALNLLPAARRQFFGQMMGKGSLTPSRFST